MKHFISISVILVHLLSCSSLDSELEQKYIENKAFIKIYTDSIGYANSPFLEIIPEKNLDQQRKKAIALMSKDELKLQIIQQSTGVPKIKEGTARTKEYFNAIKRINDYAQRYEILINDFPDLIVE